jgi:glycosyltransferase involved in cell wall biosynthesis
MADVLIGHGLSDNLRLWPRGVDTDLFDPARRSAEWRSAVGADGGEVVVTFVSRIVAEKGIAVVADVFDGLRARGVPFRGVIVGDGPGRRALEARLPETTFTGALEGEALARAYASSDVFLFPSETETFGNVTLEAMACGLPVIVADAPGSSSLVRDGVTGFLVAGADRVRFVDHIARIAADGTLRLRLGQAARREALAYGWDAVLGQLLAYYEELT